MNIQMNIKMLKYNIIKILNCFIGNHRWNVIKSLSGYYGVYRIDKCDCCDKFRTYKIYYDNDKNKWYKKVGIIWKKYLRNK